MRPARDKVVGPDVVPVFRSQSDARSIVQPESSSLRLLLRNLKSFTSPDAFNSLVVDAPPRCVEQCRDPAVTVPAVLGCQVDDLPGEIILVIWNIELATLRGPWLSQDSTGGTFTDPQSLPYVFNALAATRRAQKFPSAASFRIRLYSVRFATALFSRAFSCSSCLSFLA